MLLLADCLLLVIVHVFLCFCHEIQDIFVVSKVKYVIIIVVIVFCHHYYLHNHRQSCHRHHRHHHRYYLHSIFVYCYRPSCLQRILFFCYLFPLCDIRIKQVLFIKKKKVIEKTSSEKSRVGLRRLCHTPHQSLRQHSSIGSFVSELLC